VVLVVSWLWRSNVLDVVEEGREGKGRTGGSSALIYQFSGPRLSALGWEVVG